MNARRLHVEVEAARLAMEEAFAKEHKVQVLVIACDDGRFVYSGHGFAPEHAAAWLRGALDAYEQNATLAVPAVPS